MPTPGHESEEGHRYVSDSAAPRDYSSPHTLNIGTTLTTVPRGQCHPPPSPPQGGCLSRNQVVEVTVMIVILLMVLALDANGDG